MNGQQTEIVSTSKPRTKNHQLGVILQLGVIAVTKSFFFSILNFSCCRVNNVLHNLTLGLTLMMMSLKYGFFFVVSIRVMSVTLLFSFLREYGLPSARIIIAVRYIFEDALE